MVLLRRHGATLAGRSLRECVFRSIYTCRNAELQSRAMAMGSISTLSAGEAAMCSHHSLTPRTLSRTWEYWTHRLQKMEAMTAGAARRSPAKSATRRGKAAAKSAKRAAARPRRSRKVKRK
jgi:HCOMODA/2-hydroxy-3-carboxy-muconic semialdehyde decarboxylase